MKSTPAEFMSLCRRARRPPSSNVLHTVRRYASTNPSSSRRQVTVANDDGRVRWNDLSTREKAARSTQQSFNFLIIIAGALGTGIVAYVLLRDVISSDSKTAHFNRAADRIKRDPQCTELLGDANQIKAFGEPSWNRWQRNRPIASREEKDKYGIDHLYIHFYVQGPLNSGTVYLHVTKRPSESEHSVQYLALDVNGHSRIVLEDAEKKGDKKPGLKMFGVKW